MSILPLKIKLILLGTEMLDNVLDLETHLFSAEELQLLQTWKGLQGEYRCLQTKWGVP